jgi:hypothetical protein
VNLGVSVVAPFSDSPLLLFRDHAPPPVPVIDRTTWASAA